MPGKHNWNENSAGCRPPPLSSTTSSSTSSSSMTSSSSSMTSSMLFPRLRVVLGALESDTRSLQQQQQLHGRGTDKRGAAESLTQLLAELRNIKATLSPRVSALRGELGEGLEFLSSLRRSAHLLQGDVRELSVNLARYGYQQPPQQGERDTETEMEEEEEEDAVPLTVPDDDSTDPEVVTPEVATPEVATPANGHDPNLTPRLSDSKFHEVAMEIRLRGGLGSQLLPLTPELPQCLSVAPPAAAILPRGEVAGGHDPAAMLVGGEARAGGHDPDSLELPATPELPGFLRAAGDLVCGGDKRRLGLGSQLLPPTPELPQCLSVAPPVAILPRGEVAGGHDPAAMLVGGEARAGGHDPDSLELPATPDLPGFLRAAGMAPPPDLVSSSPALCGSASNAVRVRLDYGIDGASPLTSPKFTTPDLPASLAPGAVEVAGQILSATPELPNFLTSAAPEVAATPKLPEMLRSWYNTAPHS